MQKIESKFSIMTQKLSENMITKVPLYKLNLTSNFQLSQAKKTLRNFRYSQHKQYINRSSQMPNISTVAKVLDIDKVIWEKSRECMTLRRRELYKILKRNSAYESK